jgi:hypothetical protein
MGCGGLLWVACGCDVIGVDRRENAGEGGGRSVVHRRNILSRLWSRLDHSRELELGNERRQRGRRSRGDDSCKNRVSREAERQTAGFVEEFRLLRLPFWRVCHFGRPLACVAQHNQPWNTPRSMFWALIAPVLPSQYQPTDLSLPSHPTCNRAKNSTSSKRRLTSVLRRHGAAPRPVPGWRTVVSRSRDRRIGRWSSTR